MDCPKTKVERRRKVINNIDFIFLIVLIVKISWFKSNLRDNQKIVKTGHSGENVKKS